MSDTVPSLVETELDLARQRIAELERTSRELRAQLAERVSAPEPTESVALFEWHALARSISDVVMTVDQGGRVIFINRSLGRIPADQSIGRHLIELVAPEHCETLLLAFEQILQTGQSSHCEIAVPTEGKAYWYRTCISPLVKGEVVVAWILISSDISERKEAEAAFGQLLQREQVFYQTLEESEQCYRFLAESMPQLVWTAGPDGRSDFYNRRMLDYLGLGNLGPRDLEWHAAIHPDDREAAFVLWQKACGTGEHYEVEYRLKRADDGAYRWHLDRALPMRDEAGHVLKWFGTCTDIEEYKRAEAALRQHTEQLQAANRAKDEFLATVSHELRTPLNSILGFTQLLRRGRLDVPGAELALEAIERNARTQAKLTEDLLDVSRIIAGKLLLHIQPVSIEGILDLSVQPMRMAAEAKGIVFEVVPPAETLMVSADANRLQQILWNLISNAIKFTPEGGKIAVSASRVVNTVQFAIADTGIGIAPHFLPYVFERFRQADGSSTRTHSGLGLGLAIVRHLVELHGGLVSAESEGENRGATFRVVLPLLTPEPQQSRTPHPVI